MNNVSNIHNCYGCGVCAIACSKKIITLTLNKDGFYEPQINEIEKCTNCGLCLDVCSYSHDGLSLQDPQIASYAAWSKEPAVRRKCSSGGIGFEIGRSLIQKGYKVCGVHYNTDKGIAEHYIASTIEELIPTTGSKYIQSYTLEGFKAINRKEKYLITGTPCQIDSFRRYIQKFHCEDNFILLDFFCHGVPSMLAWRRYVHMVEKKIGKITYVSWRNKFTGWQDSWAMSMDGEKSSKEVDWHESYNMLIKEKKGSYNSRLSQGDIFYQLFLRNACLGKACYNKCKFKYNHSAADIRIGDLWGETYKNNQEGVSALISFTKTGSNIIEDCKSSIILKEHPFKIAAEGQVKQQLKEPQLTRDLTISLLKQKLMPLKCILLIMKICLKLLKNK